MTRKELHELVDIVMDAADRGNHIRISTHWVDVWVYHKGCSSELDIWSNDYPTFSDFTQAVKDYIESLG